jgi:hypothetical protein
MSYQSEHKRMKPVLDLARMLDIATNSSPMAIFEAGTGGFQVWCLPQDRPCGWGEIQMHPGSFSKPCEYVGSVHWKWDEDRIIALTIETTAYALAEQKPNQYDRTTIINRDDDLEWLKEKVTWLFQEAGVVIPPFDQEPQAEARSAPYLLAHYVSSDEEYVVIVSRDSHPEDFCRPGFGLAHTINIGKAGEFPLDVILRPDQQFQEAEIEPDEGPLVEQYENATRLGEDSWLEAAMEDQISGWEE